MNEIKKIVKILNDKETQNWINKFLSAHVNDNNLSKEEIIKLKEIVDMAQAIYNYSGESTGISDETYDILYEKLDMVNDIKITVPIISSSNKIGYHKFKSLRGTLDKIYYLSEEDAKDNVNKSRRGLPEWVASAERKIKEKTGKSINLWDEDIYVFPKWDGVSCIFEFSNDGKLERALTRGFTETNEAQIVTHIFEDIVTSPFTKSYGSGYGIKTEIMMSNDDLEKYNTIYNCDYKNSRSIVSSIMNSDEKDDRVKYLKIMQLRMSYIDENENESLQELVPGAFEEPHLLCKLRDTEKIKSFAFNHKNVNGLRCDGAVIYIINPEIQKILGREHEKQKYEVAFKFTEETGYSKVKDIKFTMGLFGSVNPILEIKPIKLKGNTIQNISLGSMARFNELKLAKGDKVKVLYDIIPYVVMDENDKNCKRSDNKPFEAPTHCPDCGEELQIKDSESGELLYCMNQKCPCRIKGKILNYFNKMHIDGISFATVDQLYEEGYLKSIIDIYNLKNVKKSLQKLEGFGKQSVKIIIDAIESNKEVSQSQMLGAIGIEGISTKTFEKILSYLSYDELLDLCWNYEGKAMNTLTEIPGIKDKSALKIINGIKENEKLILDLEEELSLIPFEKQRARFKVCFTKIRPDKKLSDIIKRKGGIYTDSLTKDIDVLVIPMSGVTSSKVTKAQKYGIPIISISETEKYINDNYPSFS